MNPLVVTGGVGKQVHLLLGNGQPIACGNHLANARGQLGEGLKSFHCFDLSVQPLANTLPLLQVFFNPAGSHIKHG